MARIRHDGPLIIGGGLAVGLALGILIALLVEMMGRMIRASDDLEHASGAPVLAMVGYRRRPAALIDRIRKLVRRRGGLRIAIREAT